MIDRDPRDQTLVSFERRSLGEDMLPKWWEAAPTKFTALQVRTQGGIEDPPEQNEPTCLEVTLDSDKLF